MYKIEIQLFEYNILKKKISLLSNYSISEKNENVILDFSDQNSLLRLKDILLQFVNKQGCSSDFTPNSPVKISMNLIAEIEKIL